MDDVKVLCCSRSLNVVEKYVNAPVLNSSNGRGSHDERVDVDACYGVIGRRGVRYIVLANGNLVTPSGLAACHLPTQLY
jgi:hypothetical protein